MKMKRILIAGSIVLAAATAAWAAKNSIADYSTTAASNTDIGGIGIQGSNSASNMDDAIRQLMAHLATFYAALPEHDDIDYIGLGGPSSGTDFYIGRQDNDGYLQLQGGNDAEGGAVRVYSDEHATQARDIEFFSNNSQRYLYDASAGVHFFNDDIRFGQNTTSIPGFGNNTQGTAFALSGGIWYFSTNNNAIYTNRTNDGTVMSFATAGTAKGSVSISGATTFFNTSSDGRLKRNFQSFDAGPILDALDVGRFEWIEDGTAGYGVIAQDANEVFPQAITHDAQTDAWSADYSKYVPLLLAEVKALRARVAELETTP